VEAVTGMRPTLSRPGIEPIWIDITRSTSAACQQQFEQASLLIAMGTAGLAAVESAGTKVQTLISMIARSDARDPAIFSPRATVIYLIVPVLAQLAELRAVFPG
jgi:hypothetical protein